MLSADTQSPSDPPDIEAVAQALMLSEIERERGFTADVIGVRLVDHGRMVAAGAVTRDGTISPRVIVAEQSRTGCWRVIVRHRGALMLEACADAASAAISSVRLRAGGRRGT